MKNIIMVIIGSFVIIYTVAYSLGMYSMYVRKNEVDKCLSYVMENTMEKYYEKYQIYPDITLPDNESVSSELVSSIRQSIKSDSEVHINVNVCDMEKGIISVAVTELFIIPGGIHKTIECNKTIIVDKDMEN